MCSVEGTAALTLRMEELWKMAGIILLPYLPRIAIIYDPKGEVSLVIEFLDEDSFEEESGEKEEE